MDSSAPTTSPPRHLAAAEDTLYYYCTGDAYIVSVVSCNPICSGGVHEGDFGVGKGDFGIGIGIWYWYRY